MNIAEHVALELGLPVGIFSAEMSARSLVKRAIASVGRVNMREIRQGRITDADFPRICRRPRAWQRQIFTLTTRAT